MELFTNDDIDTLAATEKEKSREFFAKNNAWMIETELQQLVLLIRGNKDAILDELKKNMTGFKMTRAKLSIIRSFDFSKVGGAYAQHVYDYGDVNTFIGHASETYTTSYRLDEFTAINRFLLWKSVGFLKRLEDALKLPEGMYIVIDSKVLNDDQKFFKGTDVVEYLNTLLLVYRVRK